MIEFEKLGVFYLGRESDAAGGALGAPVLYDSRHLLTHAVCIGMTGSGKTGLCISAIEEAAIDGVPAIAIDPKGDLANLLLTFPDLAPADFRPWIDEEEARRAGVPPDEFAAHQADAWKKGLADWGQDGARVARLRAAASFAIYTPGSRIAQPLSILSSFTPAARGDSATGNASDDEEALAERASTTALSLLALAGVDAELRGRDHTFMSAVLMANWASGRGLDLGGVIQQIQSPPFDRIGVLDVESFYPAKERFALATKLNAVLAAPGFEQWLEGPPLDAGRLLYDESGKPRVSIISIAHLDDAHRMFFVSLLLNEIVGWMRRQSGTSSLRAIVYMDEIAGYFPPVADPPSKGPLLTLLKQGRAFGIGVLLASQNTVDLDYKGLGNAGTWFLGRLQTERDKARVLDGLEGASGGSLDRDAADRTLSSLAKRVFLLHDVHAGAPITFMTRWALSYLRGPLSREQVRTLTGASRVQSQPTVAPPNGAAVASSKPAHDSERAKAEAGAGASMTHASARAPVLAPEIQQFFVPSAGGTSRYVPVALGVARVTFSDSKLKINEARDVVAAVPIGDGAVAVDWANAEILDIAPADLETTPAEGAAFDPVPKAATMKKNYAAWQKAFSAWLSSAQRLDLLRHAGLKITSTAGEPERDFRIRVQDAQREARDAAVEGVRRKFAEKRARAEEKLRRAEQGVAREQEQASQAKLQTGISVGAAILGGLFGRRAISATTLGRATTAARGMGRASKEAEDVARARENVAAAKQALDEIDAGIAEETTAIAARYETAASDIEALSLAPKRGGVLVQFVALGWRAAE